MMRFTLISELELKICEPEHLLKPPVWRLSRCVATQEPCLTRLKMPVSSLGGAADSGQGLVGVHKIARERGYLLPLQPSYSCQQANSVLTSSAAGFQGRASHIADVQELSLSLLFSADRAAKLH